MTLPDVDTLLTYGGATQDYSPPTSILYARKSQYVNQALSREAGMTWSAFRSALSFAIVSSAPSITFVKNVWGNIMNTAITISKTSTGVYLLTWPATVFDDIPSGKPGYSSGHLVNIRGSYAGFSDSAGTNDYTARSAVISSTTVKVFVRNGSSRALADPPTGTSVNVWVI